MTDLEYEKRKNRRLAALGTNDPKCGCCGRREWEIFERHHIAGQHYDDLIANICASCHRILSNKQKDHPPYCPTNEPALDRVGHFLLGLADLLQLIIERLYEFGLFLIALSENDTDNQVQS